MLALPFVPEEGLEEAFDTIVTNGPENDVQIMDLIKYVERTYIRGRPAEKDAEQLTFVFLPIPGMFFH